MIPSPPALRLLRPLFIAMAIFDAAFLCFVALAAWNNRLAIDDFGYLAKRNEFGTWGGAVWFYTHWTGRFAASLLIGGTGGVTAESGGHLTGYTLAMFVFIIAGLSFLLLRIGGRFKVALSTTASLVVGTFVCALLVLGTRSVGDVWFWLAGSATYIWPFGLLFFALGLLMPAQPGRGAIAGASVLLLFIPLFNDSLALLILPALTWRLGKDVWFGTAAVPPLRRLFTSPVFVPFLCCGAAWLVCSLAPGQKIRVVATGGLHFAGAPKMFLLSLVRGGGYLLLKHGHAFLLSLLVGWAVGSVERKQANSIALVRPLAGRRLRNLLLVILTVALLTFSPSILAYGFVIDRVYIYLTIALVVASFIGGATLAQTDVYPVAPRRAVFVATVATLIGATLLWGYDVFAGKTMTAYARAYDVRFASLQQLRTAPPAALPAAGEPVNLVPLPSSGPLYNAEILHNPHHWINTALQEGLQLPRPVRLAGEGVDAFR